MARILIVEDELPMRRVLTDCLEGKGHRIIVATNGESAIEKALAEKPDLVLLDVMLPKVDGFAVCAELRRLEVSVPILMLTAKGRVEDRVQGLDVGADDYLVKPFSRDELLARVRALLRRMERHTRVRRELQLGDTQIDFVRQLGWKGKTPLHFTAKEFSMLRLLAESAGEAVSRDRFLDLVWGYAAFPTTRTVDKHIAGLRAKIEADPENPRWIQTVHGVGYRLELEANARDVEVTKGEQPSPENAPE